MNPRQNQISTVIHHQLQILRFLLLVPSDPLIAWGHLPSRRRPRSEEHTSELQSRLHLVCRLLLEKKKTEMAPPRRINTHASYASSNASETLRERASTA